MTTEAIDRLAAAVLEAFGVSAEPPIPIEELAYSLGVGAIQRTALVEDGRLEQVGAHKTIFLKQAVGKARQRFTIAHELGHLIVRDPERDFIARRAPVAFDSEERFCDEFAAALLLPRPWVRREFSGAPESLGVVRNLATRTEASLAASLLRLREVLGWERSLLHWRRFQGRWRLASTAGVPRSIHNRITSAAQTRTVLDELAGSGTDLRGPLPLSIAGRPAQVPVEISVSRASAVALADLGEWRRTVPR